MWIIPELWRHIKSFILIDHWKWKFNKVLNELPKAKKIPHLAVYKRLTKDFAIIKHFQRLYFFNERERLIAVYFIDDDLYSDSTGVKLGDDGSNTEKFAEEMFNSTF